MGWLENPQGDADLAAIAARYDAASVAALAVRLERAAAFDSGYWDFRKWLEGACNPEGFRERELAYKVIWPEWADVEPRTAADVGNDFHNSLWRAANRHDVIPRLQAVDLARRIRHAAAVLGAPPPPGP